MQILLCPVAAGKGERHPRPVFDIRKLFYNFYTGLMTSSFTLNISVFQFLDSLGLLSRQDCLQMMRVGVNKRTWSSRKTNHHWPRFEGKKGEGKMGKKIK